MSQTTSRVTHSCGRTPATLLIGLAILAAVVGAGLLLHLVTRSVQPQDRAIVAFLASHRSGTATFFAHVASLGGRLWLLCLLVLCTGALMRSRLPRWTAVPLLVALFGADLVQAVDKALVKRPRPTVVHLEHVGGSSFPSGHATESAAVLTALACVLVARYPSARRRILVLVLAVVAEAAVATSRVYLGVHYPSDVVVGALLGATWGWACVWLSRGS